MKRTGLADSPLFSLQKPILVKRGSEAFGESANPSNQEVNLEIIRKNVKQFGKEPTTHRLTPEEKKSLLKLVYDYRTQGFRTSENEIVRIAINYILQDHTIFKGQSIINRLINALYA